jgi:predicted nucleic acid-binding protein
MNEDELMACIVLAEELSSKLLQQGNVANAKRILAALLRLVAEVRRLRVEIKDAKAQAPVKAPLVKQSRW